MNFWKRLFGHFRTITKHRHKVIANCAKAGILWQGLRHDLSKYTPTEFVPGVKYYTGKRSPNEGEREEYGYSKAWMHHKGRNRHHYEYWVDYNLETKRNEPVEMPYNYVAEMFCDRLAASKINPKTKEELSKLLVMNYEKGEKETFEYIRKRVKEEKQRKNKR